MAIFKRKKSETVTVKGKQLICPVCGGDHFWERRAQLNTSVASFFGLDWTNRSAHCIVCSDCTYIYWFLN